VATEFNYPAISDFQLPKNDFSSCGYYSHFSFLDGMFFQNNQRETFAEAFQKILRPSQGLRETSFILKPVSHDVWEPIVTLIGSENIVKKKGVRGQDIVADELISKNI